MLIKLTDVKTKNKILVDSEWVVSAYEDDYFDRRRNLQYVRRVCLKSDRTYEVTETLDEIQKLVNRANRLEQIAQRYEEHEDE